MVAYKSKNVCILQLIKNVLPELIFMYAVSMEMCCPLTYARVPLVKFWGGGVFLFFVCWDFLNSKVGSGIKLILLLHGWTFDTDS